MSHHQLSAMALDSITSREETEYFYGKSVVYVKHQIIEKILRLSVNATTKPAINLCQ